MTWRYSYWLAIEASRNATLWNLALMAIALVMAWEMLYLLPPSKTKTVIILRQLYLVGGLLLFFGGLIISYFVTGGQP
jgi:hypothetical protein